MKKLVKDLSLVSLLDFEDNFKTLLLHYNVTACGCNCIISKEKVACVHFKISFLLFIATFLLKMYVFCTRFFTTNAFPCIPLLF